MERLKRWWRPLNAGTEFFVLSFATVTAFVILAFIFLTVGGSRDVDDKRITDFEELHAHLLQRRADVTAERLRQRREELQRAITHQEGQMLFDEIRSLRKLVETRCR